MCNIPKREPDFIVYYDTQREDKKGRLDLWVQNFHDGILEIHYTSTGIDSLSASEMQIYDNKVFYRHSGKDRFTEWDTPVYQELLDSAKTFLKEVEEAILE